MSILRSRKILQNEYLVFSCKKRRRYSREWAFERYIPTTCQNSPAHLCWSGVQSCKLCRYPDNARSSGGRTIMTTLLKECLVICSSSGAWALSNLKKRWSPHFSFQYFVASPVPPLLSSPGSIKVRFSATFFPHAKCTSAVARPDLC